MSQYLSRFDSTSIPGKTAVMSALWLVMLLLVKASMEWRELLVSVPVSPRGSLQTNLGKHTIHQSSSNDNAYVCIPHHLLFGHDMNGV